MCGFPSAVTFVAVAAFGALMVGFSWLLSRDVRRVWRGERGRWLPMHGDFFEVTHRSYAVVAAAAGSFGAAALVVGLVALIWEAEQVPRPIAITALGLGGFGLGGLVLAGVIEATNRPRFLVPPPLRNKPGSIAARRQRRNRARREQPETDHAVALIAVESSPGSEPIQPYWVAICDDANCAWQSETGTETATRRQARRHSSRSPKVERRLA